MIWKFWRPGGGGGGLTGGGFEMGGWAVGGWSSPPPLQKDSNDRSPQTSPPIGSATPTKMVYQFHVLGSV